jgi:acyl carrier protein
MNCRLKRVFDFGKRIGSNPLRIFERSTERCNPLLIFGIALQRNSFKKAVQERCFSSIKSFSSLQSFTSSSSLHSFTSSSSPRSFNAGMKTFVTPGAPLSKSQVEHRVIDVFRAFDKVNKEKLSLSANLITDLGLDSLDLVEVTIAVEEDFNLEIPDSVAETFKTPNDIVEFMYSLCGDADLPEAERNKQH